jgi:parvulin-like peptidyl-prolyl isomerase
MAMLEKMRTGTDSASTRLLLGAVLLVFIFWTGGRARNAGNEIVAVVNGKSLTETDLNQIYRANLEERPGNETAAERQEVWQRSLQELVREEAMFQAALDAGLDASDDEVKRVLVRDRTFLDADGKFDESAYKRTVKQMGYTRAAFEAMLYRRIVLEKLETVAVSGVAVTEEDARRAWTAGGTRVRLRYVALPEMAFLDEVIVADSDRDAYAAANGGKIEERYKESYDRLYNLPKRYQLRAILLRTDLPGADKAAVKAKAEEVHAAALAGGSFEDLARTWSEDLAASTGGSLGLVAADQLDPVLAAAVEATAAGAVSAVVETGRGFQVLLVEKIEPAKTVSLDEARPEIAAQLLKESKAGELAGKAAAELLAAWPDIDAVPQSQLDAHGLRVEVTPEFAPGEDPPGIGALPELEGFIGTAVPGQVAPLVGRNKRGLFVVGLLSRQEPDPGAFAAQGEMVRKGLQRQRQLAFLEMYADDIVANAKITFP